LDPTVEEEDNGSGSGGSGSTPPPLLSSPRQEMRIKVRQISQGVEDISWKNMQMLKLMVRFPKHLNWLWNSLL
jgi:Ran-binding protein 3